MRDEKKKYCLRNNLRKLYNRCVHDDVAELLKLKEKKIQN